MNKRHKHFQNFFPLHSSSFFCTFMCGFIFSLSLCDICLSVIYIRLLIASVFHYRIPLSWNIFFLPSTVLSLLASLAIWKNNVQWTVFFPINFIVDVIFFCSTFFIIGRKILLNWETNLDILWIRNEGVKCFLLELDMFDRPFLIGNSYTTFTLKTSNILTIGVWNIYTENEINSRFMKH